METLIHESQCMYACIYTCMYECIHACCMHVDMYACIHVHMLTYMCVCMYIWMNTCMHVHIHTFRSLHPYVCIYIYACVSVHMYVCTYTHVCVPNLYSHVIEHIFHMSLNKYGCNIASITHTAIILYGHKDPTFFAYVCQNNQVQYLPHNTAMYVPATNMPLKCHIYVTNEN